MGLFKKKEGEKEEEEILRLPEIPKLPEIPEMFDERARGSIHRLPRFPNNSLGKKFSQNTIKEAITGKKEGGGFADDFATGEEMRMMQEPLKKPLTKEIYPPERTSMSKKIGRELRENVVEKEGPVFVRMDRFEDGLKALEGAKKQILEIEKLIKDTKEVKEAEERELESWEKRIQIAKEQIEKMDKNIFSKVE